jgi:hypothetical protein
MINGVDLAWIHGSKELDYLDPDVLLGVSLVRSILKLMLDLTGRLPSELSLCVLVEKKWKERRGARLKLAFIIIFTSLHKTLCKR